MARSKGEKDAFFQQLTLCRMVELVRIIKAKKYPTGLKH